MEYLLDLSLKFSLLLREFGFELLNFLVFFLLELRRGSVLQLSNLTLQKLLLLELDLLSNLLIFIYQLLQFLLTKNLVNSFVTRREKVGYIYAFMF